MPIPRGRMEFKILGPLEVHGPDGAVALGGRKQRALLALLLLRRGEAVSTDRLIDELWGDRAPATAAKSVQVYVSHLRKALGDGILETRGRGYALRLDAEELDCVRFERLLADGRARLAEGDPHGAAETLIHALDLWRGRPLAEFAYDEFARDEIERLEELHLEALEERIEAELAVGRAAGVVPELDALVRAHPLREGLRGQLMLALYQVGRQAEALEVYRDGRRLLSDELGLDPSPALQRLERQILTQDASLVASSSPRVRQRRRATALVVGASAALLLTVAAAVVQQRRGSEGAGLTAVAENSVGVVDPHSGRITAQIAVGNTPTTIAADARSVWVINADDRTVSQIDAASRRVVRTVAVDAIPTDVVAGGGAVWVGGNKPVGVTRLDADTGVVTDRLRFAPSSRALLGGSALSAPGVQVAYGFGSVWAAASIEPPRDLLARLEPTTLERLETIRPAYVGTLAVDGRAVWMLQYGTLTRVDPSTFSEARTTLPGGYGEIAADAHSVWVTDAFSNLVWQVDARDGTAVRSLDVGGGPTAVAIGFGSVWVASRDGTISRIDPEDVHVAQTIRVGRTLSGIAIADGALWVTVG